MVDLIYDIYIQKKLDDHFVLDAGHAFLGYCAVREVLGTGDALTMFKHHGTHPDRCLECGIEVSTGSLGLGATIGLGMALAEPDKDTYIATTDGALAEGSWYEVLNYVEENHIRNLKIYVNSNSYGGYRNIDSDLLFNRLRVGYPSIDLRFYTTYVEDFKPLKGIGAHYQKLTKVDYEELVQFISA
jgi:thiamine pyrophosphate-dependent acetolactate synthase large subunit-like protein